MAEQDSCRGAKGVQDDSLPGQEQGIGAALLRQSATHLASLDHPCLVDGCGQSRAAHTLVQP
eukprot:2221057-Prorocentrum_lima.AAC.1